MDKIKLISRRDFIRLTGAAAGGVAVSKLFLTEKMAVPKGILDKLSRGRGIESWQNTICRQCTGGCGIRVRKIDGVPVHVKNNPMFPVNRHGVCPMAHTSMELLFNPDRVKNPLLRQGAKGRGKWDTLTWDDALSSLNERLQKLVSAGEGHRIALINGDDSQLMRSLCRHWLKAVGSPNYYEDEKLADNSIAARLSHGIDETPSYDLTNSRYILNFGSNFLEEGSSPIYSQNVFSQLRSPGHEAKTVLIHIDSRVNITASNSDRWVPIRPGTYAALALGIAYVLIAERLYDRRFIERDTFGFSPFTDEEGRDHIGFESFVRANYYPERVSEITGVSTREILRLGEEFGTHQPSVAIADDASRYTTNGGFTQWAAYCLNALVGNIQKKGGVFFPLRVPEFRFDEYSPGSAEKRSGSGEKLGEKTGSPSAFGEVTLSRFAETVVSGNSEGIDTLLIIGANPVFHSREKETFIRALHEIDNVVYFGTFIDETALHADMVLPDHTYLEKTDVSGPVKGLMFSHVGLQRPVIEPLFDTRHTGDLIIGLGKNLTGSEIFPWAGYEDLVWERLRVLFESGEGSIISESSDADWLKYLKDRGWQLQQYESFGEFRELLEENGGWWNPSDPTRIKRDLYKNDSGRFEFVSSTLRKRLSELSEVVEGESKREKWDRLLSALEISARGDDLLLPHYESPVGSGKAEEYPLILTVSQLETNRNGDGANQPSLMEIVGIRIGKYWKSWVEINPKTAEEYGLEKDEFAWVESSKGRVNLEVRFFEGIRPGVVHIHLGLGHTSFGRFGTGVGVNVTDVLEDIFEPLTNTPARNGTRVKINKVKLGV